MLLAETYPAEALDQLGLRLRHGTRRGSKRRQRDRAGLGDALRQVLDQLQVCPSIPLKDELADGFGDDASGEDRFDSVLGLICMLSVLGGRRPDHLPEDPWVRRWEGWVLGLEPGHNDPISNMDQ